MNPKNAPMMLQWGIIFYPLDNPNLSKSILVITCPENTSKDAICSHKYNDRYLI